MSGIENLILQLKMLSFNKIKTGNSAIDTIVMTVVLSCITFVCHYVNDYFAPLINKIYTVSVMSYIFHTNIVEYEGKIASMSNMYDSKLYQTKIFSDRFSALWDYVINNIGDNDTIRVIKEYSFENPSNIKKNDSIFDIDLGVYMVIQRERFIISEKLGIYAYAFIKSETQEPDKNNRSGFNKIEKITIQLVSYKSNVKTIKNFVEQITRNYKASIAELRENKRYIYTLTKTTHEISKCEMWDEIQFLSTRTFSNIFFSEKKNIITKLDFFLNNKEWYFNKGIPYSLGIGMHGPPGTGKTSLIKAIGNYTNRHVVIISLKMIKTKSELNSLFFEDRYNLDNKKGCIGFDKKIIVFEDIDCIGDIVMDRNKKKETEKEKLNSVIKLKNKLNLDELSATSNIDISEILDTISTSTTDKKSNTNKLLHMEAPVTLDDILNLWDGIRETPGRIMIISSNHYYDLDPALIRPGRIDVSLELANASREIINEIHVHLFGETMDLNKLTNIQDNFYSPAEIYNIYMNANNDKNRFVERLLQNKHV
jgi:ATP-dependent 26S proteasome regulatory subunit